MITELKGDKTVFDTSEYNLKIFTDNIEQEALDQIYDLVRLPQFRGAKIRIMPDAHAGAGCVISITGDLGDKIIPNIVGVDISCGMLTFELGKRIIDLPKLDRFIKSNIPYSYNVYKEKQIEYDGISKMKCYRHLSDVDRLERSIGTLGGGNHFIEIDVDEEGSKYLVIHTGSRNLGHQVANYYQNLAYEKLHEEYHKSPPIPKDLCYLTDKEREDYLHDMKICAEFARLNRKLIGAKILAHLGVKEEVPSFETVHNYIDLESNIIRKGAISARKGEKVLIPLNMRDGCIVALGKGNADWNYSAPHGAGRILSRRQAKKTLSLEEFKDEMEGIYTTSVSKATLDEAPMVYKPMEEIIKNTRDTIEILKIIKPIYNFKAKE